MYSPTIEVAPAGGDPAESESVRQQRRTFQEALTAYLRASNTRDWEAIQRARARYLDEFLELEFQRHGATRCVLCGATVRHPKSVTAFRKEGGCVDYSCLCVRCLVAEQSISRHVLQRVGPILYEHYAPSPCSLAWRRNAA